MNTIIITKHNFGFCEQFKVNTKLNEESFERTFKHSEMLVFSFKNISQVSFFKKSSICNSILLDLKKYNIFDEYKVATADGCKQI